ncbi:MAG TPA: hypothetical protein DDW52_12320 [Planctomycetaceae bacterium]|nr:hypothetical protein [Planctomycetaceae bacterium]
MDSIRKVGNRFAVMLWWTLGLMAAMFHLSLAGPIVAEECVVCCGEDEVFILRIDRDASTAPTTIWTWSAKDSPEIPEAGRKSFASTDECKPVGDSLLITSSSGGVALVRRRDKRCLFYTVAKNAHSACLLPNDRVAVASSFGGDELLVYKRTEPDGSPAQPIAKIPLRGAHGALFEQTRKRLWALGSDELLLVNVDDEADRASLSIDKRVKLPTPGGHDLSRSRDPSILFVTTNKHVYRFNKSSQMFSLDPVLANEPKVKSVCEHPKTGEIVYHQGTPENWWSDTIRFIGAREDIQLPGQRLYKIRWDR